MIGVILAVSSAGCLSAGEDKVVSAAKAHTKSILPSSNTIKYLKEPIVRKIASEPNTYMVLLFVETEIYKNDDRKYSVCIGYWMQETSDGKFIYDEPLKGNYHQDKLPPGLNDFVTQYGNAIRQWDAQSFQGLYDSEIEFSVKGKVYETMSNDQRLKLWKVSKGRLWGKEGFCAFEVTDIYYSNSFGGNSCVVSFCFVPSEGKPVIISDSIRLNLVQKNGKWLIQGEEYSNTWSEFEFFINNLSAFDNN